MRKKAATACAVTTVIAIIGGWQSKYDANPDLLPDNVKSVMVSDAGNRLRFSKPAMEIIGGAESCRKTPYYCPANRLTGGIGHANDVDVGEFGMPNLTPLKEIPIEKIAEWYVSDLIDAQNCLEKNVESKTGSKLPQGVFDGVGSFTFNVGCKRMMVNPKNKKQTDLYKYLLARDYPSACNELPKYVYAAGVKQNGLVTRRGKEKALCLSKN